MRFKTLTTITLLTFSIHVIPSLAYADDGYDGGSGDSASGKGNTASPGGNGSGIGHHGGKGGSGLDGANGGDGGQGRYGAKAGDGGDTYGIGGSVGNPGSCYPNPCTPEQQGHPGNSYPGSNFDVIPDNPAPIL